MSPAITRVAIGLGFALFTLAAAPAGATVINFDGLAEGVAVTNQFPEAVFSSDPGFENRTAADFDLGTSPPNYLCTGIVGGPLTCTNRTIIDFTTPVSNLTFFAAGDNDAGPTAKVDVYQNGVLTATVDVVTDGVFESPDAVVLTGYASITRIVLHSITDGGGLGWDDFSFSEEPVAVEPASWGGLKALYR